MDIDDGWGDLSPSLEGIDLVGSFDIEDLSENHLSSLEAAAETLEENGSLKESALTKEYNNQGDQPDLASSIREIDREPRQKRVEIIGCRCHPF